MANQTEKDNTAALALLAIPGVILAMLVVMIPFALFNAWVTKTLYDWFILPLGAPALSIWHMWGISLLASRFLPSPEYKGDGSVAKAVGKLIDFVLAGLLALLIGYFVKGMV
jgi:hypothetical protein